LYFFGLRLFSVIQLKMKGRERMSLGLSHG
jgi:hypothetical protein